MKLCKMALTAVAGLGLMTAAADAAPITIDSFNNGDAWVSDGPFFTFLVPENETGSTGAIGGFRDIEADSDATDPLSTEVRVSGGSLQFSNRAGASGTGYITWDGQDGSANSTGAVNTTGLGGTDITDGGTNELFRIALLTADANLEITINVWDMVGGFSSISTVFEASLVDIESWLRLDEFSGDADFTNVGAIQLVLDGPENLDAVIDFIQVAPVPLGPALPPLVGAFLMLGYLKRRQHRA